MKKPSLPTNSESKSHPQNVSKYTPAGDAVSTATPATAVLYPVERTGLPPIKLRKMAEGVLPLGDMSKTEYTCRMTIATAYAAHKKARNERPMNLLSFMRSLSIVPEL
jgi:hypothetical protein